MGTNSGEHGRHGHVFLGAAHARNERRVRVVVGLTLAMMVGEIVAGSVFGSMALLADGWHMATHAGALSISALAYAYARRRAHDPRFAFGTGKVGDLAGFTSAVLLAAVACLIGWEGIARLIDPRAIRFDEAIWVAALGLAVNLASARMLHHGEARAQHGPRETHRHEKPHASHGQGDLHAPGQGGHHDHNLRSAYLHVLADALTSVFAIAALCAGKFLDWHWMDPLCGVVGAAVILRWSVGLLRDTGAVLLDVVPDPRVAEAIRERIERQAGDRILDLHVWRVGPGHLAAIVAIASDDPRDPAEYASRLSDLGELAHLTVEVRRSG